MKQIIRSGPRCGAIQICSSKSMAQRYIIAAALSREESVLECRGISKDIVATIDCLNAMGAEITVEASKIFVRPIYERKSEAVLNCGESAATLRFMLPIAAAFGINTRFVMNGRLSQRPLEELERELKRHGVELYREEDSLMSCGLLRAGEYSISAKVSSQYISSLLLSLPLLDGNSTLKVDGKLNSASYISMTEDCLRKARIRFDKTQEGYSIGGKQRYNMPRLSAVEGDWSAAAVFLCMGAVSKKGIEISGLDINSLQGDRRIIDILKGIGAKVDVSNARVKVKRGKLCAQRIDVSDIPDIAMPLALLATVCEGESVLENITRLRYKESDRLSATMQYIKELGGKAYLEGDSLIVGGGTSLKGAPLDSCADHRMAMTAAAAACLCAGDIELYNAQCVGKSYHSFWQDYDSLEVEHELLR